MDKAKKRILWKGLLIGVLGLVALNFPPLSWVPILVGVEPMFHVYDYVSSDGEWDNAEVPEKGRDIHLVEAQFERYKKQVRRKDLVLYRESKRDWWRVWNWWDYATNPRWKYPFLESGKFQVD